MDLIENERKLATRVGFLEQAQTTRRFSHKEVKQLIACNIS